MTATASITRRSFVARAVRAAGGAWTLRGLNGPKAIGVLRVIGGLTAGGSLPACGGDSPRFVEPANVDQNTGHTLDSVAKWWTAVTAAEMAAGVVGRVNDGLGIDDLFASLTLATVRMFNQASLEHASLWTGAARALVGEDLRLATGTAIVLRHELYSQLKWQQDNIPVSFSGLPEPAAIDNDPKRFHDARSVCDYEAAEKAVVGLLRNKGEGAVRALLVDAALRDFSGFGHKQIAVDQLLRRADSLGWAHAEPLVRALSRRLVHPDEGDVSANTSDYFRNVKRALHSGERPGNTGEPVIDAVLKALRTSTAATAADLVYDKLKSVDASLLWDAVVLHSLEAVGAGGPKHAGLNLHRFTGTHALRSLASREADPIRRQLCLLQAASYVRWFTKKSATDATFQIDSLAASDEPVESADVVFASLKSIRSLDQGETGATQNAMQAQQLQAVTKLRRFLDTAAENEAVWRRALAQTLLRTATSAHDWKFPFALFEEATRVAPAYRSRVLAMTAFAAPGSDAPDSVGYTTATAALSAFSG